MRVPSSEAIVASTASGNVISHIVGDAMPLAASAIAVGLVWLLNRLSLQWLKAAAAPAEPVLTI